jgi:hypothetical protein
MMVESHFLSRSDRTARFGGAQKSSTFTHRVNNEEWYRDIFLVKCTYKSDFGHFGSVADVSICRGGGTKLVVTRAPRRPPSSVKNSLSLPGQEGVCSRANRT